MNFVQVVERDKHRVDEKFTIVLPNPRRSLADKLKKIGFCFKAYNDY